MSFQSVSESFCPAPRGADSSGWTPGNEDTHQASASGPFPPLNLESQSVQTVTWGQFASGDSILGRQPRQHRSDVPPPLIISCNYIYTICDMLLWCNFLLSPRWLSLIKAQTHPVSWAFQEIQIFSLLTSADLIFHSWTRAHVWRSIL